MRLIYFWESNLCTYILTDRLSVCNDIIDQVGPPVEFGCFTL